MKKLFVLASIALVAVMARANLMENPSFENPIEMTWSAENETTNWFGWGEVQSVDSGWKTPQEGSQSLVVKNWLGGGAGVEQKSDVTADTAFDLSFYSLWDGGYNGTMDVQVRWIDSGGAQIGSNTIVWTMGTEDAWTLSSSTVTSLANTARAEFNFSNTAPDTGAAGAMYLDNVNFDVQAIPEPTAAILGLLGAGLLFLRRSKRK